MLDQRCIDFLINDFSHIGWDDPFSFESKTDKEIALDNKLKELNRYERSINVEKPYESIYAEYRYIEGFAPTVVYIPNSQVMMKMMRSCIGITDPKDLWIN